MNTKIANLVVLRAHSPIVVRVVVSGPAPKSHPSIHCLRAFGTSTIEALFFGKQTLRPKFTFPESKKRQRKRQNYLEEGVNLYDTLKGSSSQWAYYTNDSEDGLFLSCHLKLGRSEVFIFPYSECWPACEEGTRADTRRPFTIACSQASGIIPMSCSGISTVQHNLHHIVLKYSSQVFTTTCVLPFQN